MYGSESNLKVLSSDSIAGQYSIDLLVHNQFHIDYVWSASTTGTLTPNVNTGGLEEKVNISDIVNNTSSTATDKPLSANMGKDLQDQINNLSARGRFLALWNATTGLASTSPTVLPYTYRTGDYFIVGTVGTTNYKPTGTQYTGVASTSVETAVLNVDDVYYYDGTTWHLQVNTRVQTSFANITGQPTDNVNLAAALSGKQNTITSSNKLSADLLQDGTNNKVFTATDKATINNLSTVATSGSYNDLSDKPNIPEGVTLYGGTGQNTDGAMTQKAATDALNGKIPTTRKVNNKALSSDITLNASDVGALADTTTYVSSVNGSSGAVTVKEIFWCTYGTTTFTEIKQALNSGKLPCVKLSSDSVYVYGYSDNSNSCMFYYISSIDGTTINCLKCTDSNWTLFYPTVLAKTSDIPTKTSDLTNDSGFITSSYHDSTKMDTFTISQYVGTSGNPRPTKVCSVNYTGSGSENSPMFKFSIIGGHGNAMSYIFNEDVNIAVGYDGTVTCNVSKYYEDTVTYEGVARAYGDIFYVVDTTNKIVDFYCLAGQYSYIKMTPYFRTTTATAGTITQPSTSTIYSSGTKVWANNGVIATTSDLGNKADKVSNATNNHVAKLNSSGNLVDSGYSINEFDKLFECTYGVTTWNEIATARNNGLIPYLYKDNKYYYFNSQYQPTLSQLCLIFASICFDINTAKRDISTISITQQGNVWREDTYDVMVSGSSSFTSNHLTVFDSSHRIIDSGKSVSDFVPSTRTVNSKTLSSNITLTASDVGAITASDLLTKVYPVGSVYLSVSNTSPASFLGGSWEQIGADYALWTATSGAGNTLGEQLPNIKGVFEYNSNAYGSALQSNANWDTSGPFSVRYKNGLKGYNDSSSSAVRATGFYFNAHSANAIYTDSGIVRPNAYKVYAWKRTA